MYFIQKELLYRIILCYNLCIRGLPLKKVSATLMNCYTLGKWKTFVIVLALIMNIMKIGSRS